MNASEYKLLQESYMANNHGSDFLHTYFSVQYVFLWPLLVVFRPKIFTKSGYVYEYCLIILPIILGMTIYADYIYHINMVLLTIVLLYLRRHVKTINVKEYFYTPNVYKNPRLKCISLLRAMTYLLTTFCILAVDFRIFPRYLAKTERYGYSLMDTGVGLFVLMSGLVHKSYQTNIAFKKNLKSILMLTAFGLARFVAVKCLDYQEHVTEYGVHWNFFFTLAVTKLVSYIIMSFIHKHALLVVSCLLCFAYESILSSGVQAWIFSDAPRDTLLSANREGIFSCFGFVALYLFAVHLKTRLMDRTVQRMTVLYRLFVLAFLLAVGVIYVDPVSPISRTLANTSYCLYVSFILVSVFTSAYMFEIAILNESKDKILIIDAINHNGLLYFLYANLLTGLVNMSVQTLLVDEKPALMLLNAYMIFTTYFVVYLQYRGIKL